MKFLKYILLIPLFLSTFTYGEMELIPRGVSTYYRPSPNLETPTYPSLSGIVYEPNCYGKNNRGTNNPLDPNGTVVTTISVDEKSYDIRFTAGIIKPKFEFDGDSLGYLVDKVGPASCKSICVDHPVLCDPLSGDQSSLFSAFNTLDSRISNSFNGAISGVHGQLYSSSLSQFLRKLFVDEGVACQGLDEEAFVAISAMTKEYCIETGSPNPCFENRMCEIFCGIGSPSRDNTCIMNCQANTNLNIPAVVTGSGACQWRPSEEDKTTTTSYQPLSSCAINTILFNDNLTIKEDTQVTISHFQANGKAGSPNNYVGFEGPMPDPKNNVTVTEGMIRIRSEFPGEDGFCGGYHSPLMVFFDRNRPQFNNVSDFLYRDKDKRLTYWPEKNHPGYFLAKLEKGNKGISSPSQLFGDREYLNGFEALEALDTNGDGIIDHKDQSFSKIVLWKDIDGNGKSSPKEIVSLKEKGISQISLKKLDNSFQYAFGNKATARGRIVLEIKKNKKKNLVEIVDIFFSDFNL